ncbi:MAG: hypothetical protein U0531_13495 [Dehalococcoidia bacterium]
MARSSCYSVRQVADSLEALIEIEEHRPALVIIWWDMPFIDGAVLTRAVRSAPRRAAADPGPGRVRRAAGLVLRAGAQAWLDPPFDPESLLRLVDALPQPPPPRANGRPHRRFERSSYSSPSRVNRSSSIALATTCTRLATPNRLATARMSARTAFSDRYID